VIRGPPLCAYVKRSDPNEEGRLLSRPSGLLAVLVSSFDDLKDLVGVLANNDVLAVHQDEVISTPPWALV
jgi:hypothetical protein